MRLVYDEVSPFTGKRSVMIEPDAEAKDFLKICMDTGYHTYQEKWKTGSEYIENVENTFPNVVLSTKRECDDGNTWYRIVLLTPFVMLVPEEENDDFVWCIYTLKNADPKKDQVVMEVEDVEGNPLYRCVDMDTRKVFPDNEFSLAMDAFQTIGASVYGKIFDMISEEKTEE